MFQEALREIVDGTEGGIAGLLMDSEGIAVESYAKRRIRRSTSRPIGVEFSVVLGSIKRAAEMLEAGTAQRGRDRHRQDDHAHPHARATRTSSRSR